MVVARVRQASRILMASVALVAMWGAAGPSAAETGRSSAPAPPGGLTVDQARNAAISGVYDTPVALKDGVFEGPPFVAGGASRPRLVVVRDLVALGNLDAAPGDEAAVLLAENSGGSGERIYLSLIALRGGAPASIGTVLVGDRTKIISYDVTGPDVVMEVVEAGPNDPACCPTQLARKVYALEGGELKLKRSEVKGTLSMALLAGAEWTAAEIDGKPILGGDKRPTVSIDGGRIVGFGGCNRYTGSIREVSPGEIAIGPLAATKMACAETEMRLEERFIASLASANRYTFLAGRLVLSGMDGDIMRSVLLTRQ